MCDCLCAFISNKPTRNFLWKMFKAEWLNLIQNYNIRYYNNRFLLKITLEIEQDRTVCS